MKEIVITLLGCTVLALSLALIEAGWTQAPDRIAVFREQERKAIAEPFKGITTHGQVMQKLFGIKSTGVSTRPVRDRIHSPVILIEFDHQSRVAPFRSKEGSREHIHTVVRTPNGNDYDKDLLRQHHARQPHGGPQDHLRGK